MKSKGILGHCTGHRLSRPEKKEANIEKKKKNYINHKAVRCPIHCSSTKPPSYISSIPFIVCIESLVLHYALISNKFSFSQRFSSDTFHSTGIFWNSFSELKSYEQENTIRGGDRFCQLCLYPMQIKQYSEPLVKTPILYNLLSHDLSSFGTRYLVRLSGTYFCILAFCSVHKHTLQYYTSNAF